MRFNRAGQALQGIAGAVTAVDGVPIVPERCCGGWFWLHDDLPAGQVCVGSACSLQTATGTVLSSDGAYFFAAGGGRWMALLERFQSNFLPDHEYIGAAPLWIDHDGNAAILRSYQTGWGIRVVRANGAVIDRPWTIHGPVFAGECGIKINDGLLTVRQPDGWHIIDTARDSEIALAAPAAADAMMACRAGDRIVIIERLISDASLRVRFADQHGGTTVAGGMAGDTYYPAIVALGPDRVRVGWSRTQNDLDASMLDLEVSQLPGSQETERVTVTIADKVTGLPIATIAIVAVAAGAIILTSRE